MNKKRAARSSEPPKPFVIAFTRNPSGTVAPKYWDPATEATRSGRSAVKRHGWSLAAEALSASAQSSPALLVSLLQFRASN